MPPHRRLEVGLVASHCIPLQLHLPSLTLRRSRMDGQEQSPAAGDAKAVCEPAHRRAALHGLPQPAVRQEGEQRCQAMIARLLIPSQPPFRQQHCASCGHFFCTTCQYKHGHCLYSVPKRALGATAPGASETHVPVCQPCFESFQPRATVKV